MMTRIEQIEHLRERLARNRQFHADNIGRLKRAPEGYTMPVVEFVQRRLELAVAEDQAALDQLIAQEVA